MNRPTQSHECQMAAFKPFLENISQGKGENGIKELGCGLVLGGKGSMVPMMAIECVAVLGMEVELSCCTS